jgi:hypothetical protein
MTWSQVAEVMTRSTVGAEGIESPADSEVTASWAAVATTRCEAREATTACSGKAVRTD